MRSMAKVVSADGTVLDEPSKILPNGDVVDSSLIERRSASADDMLAEIQSLVKSTDKGSRDGIVEIQSLAKQLVEEVKDDRDKEAAEVPVNLQSIDKCNSDSTSQQQTIKSSDEQSVNSRRSTHATC